MANYDLTKYTLLKHLQTAAQKAHDFAANAIRSGKVDGNTVSFYTSADKTGEAAFSFDFPNELVLDQLKTKFVPKFTFSTETYSGATAPEPSLDNKPVLVIAVKDTDAKGKVTTNYSFLDMTTLVDTYTPKDASIAIDGYNINVKISQATGNKLSLKEDGLFVDTKVEGATSGHLAAFDDAGNIVDSGHGTASDAEVTEMLTEIYG